MRINRYKRADGSVAEALRRLTDECSGPDGFRADIDLDPSMNAEKNMSCVFTCEEQGKLVALLSVFAPGREDIEVSALVHPDWRNRGYFKALIKETIEESAKFGYKQGMFVCNSASEPGGAVMRHWNCGTDHIELQMECDDFTGIRNDRADIEVMEARESDIEQLGAVGEAAFGMDRESEREHINNTLAADGRTQYAVRRQGRFAAMCAASENGGCMMIFGLGVHPGERRRGYAKALIGHIADIARQRGISKLCLDVDEDNEGAIALYESLGFKRTGRTEYRTFYFEDFQ